MHHDEPKLETRGDQPRGAQAPALPFSPLPELEKPELREIEAAAMEANDRYLLEFVEEHSFCPFSRGGRAQGQTARFVHYFSGSDISPLIDLMVQAAADPSLVVVQAILPMIEIDPEAWIRFCQQVTAAGNAHLGGDAEVFAVAALHPELTYNRANAFALVPLLRRSPDPTIQWVRLDGLEALYEGRSGETIFLDGCDVMPFMQKKHRPPLFNRIAETNLRMAERLGIDRVEQTLAEISRSARKRYTNILLGGTGSPQLSPARACPCSGQSASTPCADTPAPVLAGRRDDAWSLAVVRELKQREPCHVRVDDIDLVVVRAGKSVHVLYGRCPHRLALLSDAILENKKLICRHHGWDFRLDTGASEGVPGESVHRFAAWVEEGQVWIKAAEVEQWRIANPQAFELGELMP